MSWVPVSVTAPIHREGLFPDILGEALASSRKHGAVCTAVHTQTNARQFHTSQALCSQRSQAEHTPTQCLINIPLFLAHLLPGPGV